MKGRGVTMEIELSEIEIIPVRPKEGLIGFCSFVINNSFYVGDVAIYGRLEDGNIRLVYPKTVLSNGLKISVFHPINKYIGDAIERQVANFYLGLLEKVKKMKGERDGTNGRLPNR